MATRVIAAQDKTSSGAGDDVQIKAGSANTSGAGGSIIIQPGAQATSGGDGIVIVRQPSGTAGTDEIQLLHNGSRGSIINKDGALQLGGANIAIRNAANNANTTLTATTLYATGIYSSNVINADGVTSDSYSWGIDDSSLNWGQGFNLRVGWSHIRGYANCGIAYTGNNTNGRRATLEVTDGSAGGGAWAYRSATTTVNTSYNDLNLAGHSAFQRLNATAATTITGIAPASTAGGSGFPTWIHTDGRIFWLYNVGTFNVTLANESASSTAGNRVTTQTGANVILGPGRMMQIVYDGTSSRWRTSGETYPYVFPTTDGTNGQVLTTNGSGTLSWTTVSSSSGTVTSVSGTGTVNGITLTGTVTSSGSLTLGGTLSGVSLATQVTGTLPIANGGTGTTTAQLAINALAGAVTSGSYLRGNGTNIVMAAIQAADVPTLNQNTTGTASGSVSGTASYLAKFTSTNVVGNSQIVDNGTSIGIGISSPSPFVKIHCQISSGGNWSFNSQGATGNFGAGFYIDGNNAGQMLLADGTGTYKAQISSSGASYVTNSLGVGTSSPGAQLQVTTAAAATKGLIVKGVASQSANLTEWQDNTGAVVAAVSPTGAFTGSSFTPYGTFNSTTTIFGNNYWTPNYTGGVTSPSAGTYTKSTGSANVWNGQVYSSEGYTKNVYCAARASQTNGNIMFGLNSDPATDGNYTSLDYAWYFLDNATLMIYENGAQGASYGAYTTSTVLSITYDGSNVQYWKDGVIQRTVARSTGNPLYFDTSFYTLSSSLNSVQFGPIGQPFGISGTSGYLPKFTSQQTLGNSIVYDNGTNVGVGTASPADRLEVSGATNKNVKIGTVAGGLDTSSYNPDISTLGGIVGFQTGISTDYRGSIYAYADSSSNAKLAISSRSDIVFVSYKGNNADSRAMVIKETTGNVGIGTASPNMALHVVGAKAGDANEGQGQLNVESTAAYNATNGTVFSTSGAGGSVLFRGKYNSGGAVTGFAGIAGSKENTTDGHYGGNLRFYTRANGANDPPERMRIDASGNVGIGTTTMNDTLNIYNATYPYIRLTGSSATAGMRIGVESTSFAQIGVYQANMPLTFSTSGTSSNLYNERMRISHDGLVGIGSSSPGAKLQVDTGATGTKGQIIKAFLGQAANLSEWQDSNGNILAYVSPNASIISTPAVCSIGSNGNDGGVLKLYSAGFGLRITSLNGDIISGNVNSVNITPGAGGNTIGLNVSCNMGASGVVAQFANNGNAASKVVVVKGIANQSGSLQDWQNSAGTALAYMDANGNFFAVSKSFLIPHPTPAKAAEGKKLRYASLEGPENGVYYRGRLEGESEIVLPDYWKDLVDPESITVNLTARKFAQPSLFVVDANAEKVIVESDREINCDFVVFATRRDIAKLEVEPDGE